MGKKMIKHAKQHKYQIIIDYVTNRIMTGEYQANMRIPSENEFARMLDVSSITIRKALSDLVNEGLIYRIKGKGSFIADQQKKTETAVHALAAFLIAANIHDGSVMKIIKGMQKKLSEAGFSLIVENLTNYVNLEKQVIDRLMENRVAGFIVYPDLPANAEALRYLSTLSVPFVVLDRYPKGQPVNFVGCNNFDGARAGANHLISLGHEKIGFLAHAITLSSEKERYEGYIDAMQAASLPVKAECLFTEETADWNKIAECVRNASLTALVCVNDLRAFQVMENLIARGVSIPGDLSVVGFDNADFAAHAPVPITTVRQSFQDLGYAGAQLLLDIRKDPRLQNTRIQLGTELMIRKSTRRLIV